MERADLLIHVDEILYLQPGTGVQVVLVTARRLNSFAQLCSVRCPKKLLKTEKQRDFNVVVLFDDTAWPILVRLRTAVRSDCTITMSR